MTMNINHFRGRLTHLALVTMTFGLAAMTAKADDRWTERVPFKATFAVTGHVIFPGAPGYLDYTNQCYGAAPVQVIQGVGDASYLGLFTDTQSHCLGLPDATGLPFFNGHFTFTSPQGRTLSGEYHGQLTPTITSTFPDKNNPAPGGSWIIEGMVCVSGGTVFRGIVDDCAAGRFTPARGISLLNGADSQGTLYLDQTIGVRR
jgi:hypothetical protein